MHEPECGKQLNNIHLYFPVIAAVKNNLHQVTTQRGKKKVCSILILCCVFSSFKAMDGAR